jgi:hypothetical protein
MALIIQGLLIGFFGSALYVTVDKYEPDRALAFMLKSLVVMWALLPLFITPEFSAMDFSKGTLNFGCHLRRTPTSGLR